MNWKLAITIGAVTTGAFIVGFNQGSNWASEVMQKQWDQKVPLISRSLTEVLFNVQNQDLDVRGATEKLLQDFAFIQQVTS